MKIYSYIVKGSRQKVDTEASRACKLLANPARYRIVRTLMNSRGDRDELCVNEIADVIGMSQSATSHQLALLEAHSVVEAERMGQSTCYHLTRTPFTRAIERIVSMFPTSFI